MGYTHGIKWDDAEIERQIKESIQILNVDHFPTHNELINLCSNRALAVALSKHGGTKYWADKLNMPIKQCESSLGTQFEQRAIKDIKKYTGLTSVLTVPRYPYDVYTAECVRIDIKASTPIKDRSPYCWSFNIEKKMPTCDIFIFYCLDEQLAVQRTYIIPSMVFSGCTQVGIGQLSKYDNYINQWQFIIDYHQFYMQQKDKIALVPKRRSTN